MRTVGQILTAERKKQSLSLSAVAQATKIRPQFLQAIEKNEFEKLPSATTAQGFVRNYAQFLALPAEMVLAVYRRDFARQEKEKVIPKGLTEPLDKTSFWSRSWRFILPLAAILIFLFVYFGGQYFTLWRGPDLEVASPPEGAVFYQETVEISGRTDIDAVVTLDGEPVKLTDGQFKIKTGLFPGENQFVIEATNRLGKKTRIIRKIFKEE